MNTNKNNSNTNIIPNNAIQHGEVWMSPINDSDIPTEGVTVTESFEAVIGHSESGHNHVLTAERAAGVPFEVIKKIGDTSETLFIRLKERARIIHQKAFDRHEDTEVVPQSYKVIIKQEFNPIADVWRKVRD